MNTRYALVNDGIVIDLVAWNGEGNLFPDFDAIKLIDDVPVMTPTY